MTNHGDLRSFAKLTLNSIDIFLQVKIGEHLILRKFTVFAYAGKLANGPTTAFASMKDNLDYTAVHSVLESLGLEADNMTRTAGSPNQMRQSEPSRRLTSNKVRTITV